MKSPNQKLKILYIRDFLLRESDDNHPVSVKMIIENLAAHGITAERKSIYDDLEALMAYGMEIITDGRKGYHVGEREFQLSELKLLVDSVQSSKFITEKKTHELIRKIEALAGVYDAQLLHRQVYVTNRVKSMNESVYYNVDGISDAIARDRRILFRYFEITPEKTRRYRHEGKLYELSPFALMWDSDNYYMLAWDEPEQKMKHFRVDKMSGIEVTELERQGHEVFEGIDLGEYAKKTFGMFSGEEMNVRLRFANHLAGAVIDRFGNDVILIPDGAKHFRTTLPVMVSPRFLGWLYGFGTDAEILSPQPLRQRMREECEKIAALYADDT